MAKRLLYAAQALAFQLLVTTLVVTNAADARAERVPCGGCVALAIDAGQAILLPERLHGVEILVRADSGSPQAIEAALEAIDQASGRAGVLVDAYPLQNLSLDDVVFRLRTRTAEVRARFPRARLVLIAPAKLLNAFEREIDYPPDADAMTTSAGAWTTLAAALTDWQPVRDLPRDALVARGVLRDVAIAAEWLDAQLVAEEGTAVTCGGKAVPAYRNLRSGDLIALAPGCPPEAEVRITPERRVERVHLTGLTILRARSTTERVAEDVVVSAPRQLTVREVIARHQAAVVRQRNVVRTSIASGAMTLTFEAPGFPAPVTISSDAVIFTGADVTEIQQRNVRVNGIAFSARGIPRLPIIEPERAASPPLTITLTELYRYELKGQDTIGGRSAYVVAFEPIDSRRSLFRGRAWIDATTFGMVKVAATQTALRGAIVSSEQVDEFRLEQDVWLLARSEVRQLYEGAAHRTPIHRVLTIAQHDVNPATFEARRMAAYASPDLMLRDTSEGFRYLRRERTSTAAGAPQVVAEIAGRADRVRTLALGVIVDPNISRPLPFAGLSYVDFNLFGTGTQFNGFFGGTYAQAAFSVPSVGGSRWQMAGRAFGIASSYNDRSFVAGREIYEQGIRQRPAHASVWLLRPLSPRVTFRLGYELDYTQFGAAAVTARDFIVPADQVAHAARMTLEGQRYGWTASVWWAPARRTGWRAWGRPGDYEAGDADYQRYGVTLTRPFVVSPRLVGRLEGAWMDGHDLDRFSRYSFGTFDNRLRGYPSALIRYDRGVVARGALAWAAARHLRVDGFLDSAYVHDPGFGGRMRNYTGVGAALEAPAPFGTLVAVEWGYGFRGVNTDGSLGTHIIRVSAFKLF